MKIVVYAPNPIRPVAVVETISDIPPGQTAYGNILVELNPASPEYYLQKMGEKVQLSLSFQRINVLGHTLIVGFTARPEDLANIKPAFLDHQLPKGDLS